MLKRPATLSASPFSQLENLEARRLMAASYAIGINVNDGAGSTVGKVVPVMKNLGVQTVRLWATVNDFSSRSYSSIFDRAIDYSNAGFDVTLEVNTANGKVPSAAAVKGWFDWASGISSVKNAVDRWEIGNEPDHAQYWNGSLSQYVNTYLKPAAEALHANGETVVSAGPSYNPDDVQTMIDAGMLNYTDYVGFHPYAKGVSGVKKSIAAINAVVAGRKPIAVTEWNVRGFEGDKTAWAQAVADVFPSIRDGFALNYYFALKTQNSMAGPAGILNSSLNLNQPFYNAFATFRGAGGSTPIDPTPPSTGGSTPAGSGSVSGTLFNDDDTDGKFDTNEKVTGSRTVYLDANGNGKFDKGEKSTTSSSKGAYTFSGLAKGTYKVSRVFASGYKLSNSSAGYVTATLAIGQKLTGVNIGTTKASTPVVIPPVVTPPVVTPPPVTTPGTTPGTGTGPKATAFQLVNASTNQVIGSINTITGNATVKLALLPKGGINIKVVTSGNAGSVKMTALGKTLTESTAPFAVFGDKFGDYAAWAVTKGSYTVTATAYSGANGTGTQGSTLTATITFV